MILAAPPQQRPLDASGFPAIPGVTHKTVTVNGADMHYAEAGSGEPLVLIHGFPENWYVWRDVIPELAKHYRVIAPDMPGSGWSQQPANKSFVKADLAEDMAAFMDAVGAPRAKVMAHDWGGFVGFMLALNHPEKVSQYLAMNIATPWPNPKAAPDLWRWWYQIPIATPVVGAKLLQQPDFVKKLLALAGTQHPESVWTPQDLAMYTDPFQLPGQAIAGSKLYRSFLTKELIPLFTGANDGKRLTMPTQLLFGENDAALSTRMLDGFERHADDMKVDVVPDVGHFMIDERPDVVVQRALEFFGAGAAVDAAQGAAIAHS